MDCASKHYVSSDVEVKLTGRIAIKPGVTSKSLQLVEITPADENNGTWKKWVPFSSLFEIQG